MPIYDFLCANCGHQDDLIRKMSDSSLMVCPKCTEEVFKKQVSAPNFKLIGSGWYATDFKDKKSTINQNTLQDKSKQPIKIKGEKKHD